MQNAKLLEAYKKKRKFDKTPEPKPKVKETGLSHFVVQEHHATRLHWDFRLEMDVPTPRNKRESGSRPESVGRLLKSWAVPKGVPEKAGIRRLAIQVEDHPTSYFSFQGRIPEGQYGAGTVKIWDKGNFKLFNRTEKLIDFELQGKRLKGNYVLIHTRNNQWIIFKKK